ncbi:ArsR/SmtB family transcription factor [Streptomyces sp. NPDC058092]|uniref:ArsR/SmtB family transcription factor n=1 Tax=Streptomyces sp. NPDC058092 TaxID=3346336 RepID=UPI0036EAB785
MLRFHLTNQDLTRLRVAPRPHPLWEIYFSLLALQSGEAALHFAPWRQTVRRALAQAGLTDAVHALTCLYPLNNYSPDFLVPGDEPVELETGLDLLMSTPRSTLQAQMNVMRHGTKRLPDWCRNVADGDPNMMKRLGDLLSRYHSIAVAPYTGPLQEAFAAERELRANVLAESGVEGLISSYPPQHLDWREDTLSMHCSLPKDISFHVDGRPLMLLPSFFSLQTTASVAKDRPLTLGYPVTRQLGWHARTPHTMPGRPAGRPALDRLIGTGRAAALDVLDSAMNTSQLAEALHLSLPTASRHAAALREAGLVASRRSGQSVLHTRTPLGTALLEGQSP